MARMKLEAACSEARSRSGFRLMEVGIPDSGSRSSERLSTGPWLFNQASALKNMSRITPPMPAAMASCFRENSMLRASVARPYAGAARLRPVYDGTCTAGLQRSGCYVPKGVEIGLSSLGGRRYSGIPHVGRNDKIRKYWKE